jgi:presenilin-like A22 family membrane protease
MKHNLKITIILLGMFIITQLIGLAVVNYYLDSQNIIPYGFDNSRLPEQSKDFSFYSQLLASFITSFIIAILIIFLLMKIKSEIFLRIWFFVVITVALGITITAIIGKINIPNSSLIALVIAISLAYIKVFKKNLIVHNITELLIYPGIAAIFVTIFNLWTTIALLIIISIYDIWAVWHSGIMQKMAKFQINKVGVFSGYFIPYASKAVKEKIKNLKLKYNNKIPKNIVKKSKLKVNLAILGGGDVVFPIIAAGVMLKTFNSFIPALIVVLFSCLALLYLFVFAEKKKFYPAMPYLTTGIFIGMIIGRLVMVFL